MSVPLFSLLRLSTSILLLGGAFFTKFAVAQDQQASVDPGIKLCETSSDPLSIVGQASSAPPNGGGNEGVKCLLMPRKCSSGSSSVVGPTVHTQVVPEGADLLEATLAVTSAATTAVSFKLTHDGDTLVSATLSANDSPIDIRVRVTPGKIIVLSTTPGQCDIDTALVCGARFITLCAGGGGYRVRLCGRLQRL